MPKYNNWCDEAGNYTLLNIEDSEDKQLQIIKHGNKIIQTDNVMSLSPRTNVDSILWRRLEKYGRERTK